MRMMTTTNMITTATTIIRKTIHRKITNFSLSLSDCFIYKQYDELQ